MKYLLTIFLLISFNSAIACSPIWLDPKLKDWRSIEKYNKADLIISGKFTNIEIVRNRIISGTTFKVKNPDLSNIVLSKVYKGKLPAKLIIEFISLSCGQSVKLDTEYLIYAEQKSEKFYFTEAPTELKSANTDLKIIKEVKYKFINPEIITREQYIKKISSNKSSS